MGSSQINVGPLDVETRDNLAAFRDERDLPNDNEALKVLLDHREENTQRD